MGEAAKGFCKTKKLIDCYCSQLAEKKIWRIGKDEEERVGKGGDTGKMGAQKHHVKTTSTPTATQSTRNTHVGPTARHAHFSFALSFYAAFLPSVPPAHCIPYNNNVCINSQYQNKKQSTTLFTLYSVGPLSQPLD